MLNENSKTIFLEINDTSFYGELVKVIGGEQRNSTVDFDRSIMISIARGCYGMTSSILIESEGTPTRLKIFLDLEYGTFYCNGTHIKRVTSHKTNSKCLINTLVVLDKYGLLENATPYYVMQDFKRKHELTNTQLA